MTSNTGTQICGILLTIFIVLKLTHVIGWSWWWVISPLWIPIAVALGVVGVLAILALIRTIFD